MGELVPIVSNPKLDDRLRKVDKRFDRHQGLVFQVRDALRECRKQCPPSRRRELVNILKFFERFPLDEWALRASLVCLKVKLEQYEAAA